MRKVYFAITLIALYGDIIKRYLPANIALAVLYASAALVLVALARRRDGVINLDMSGLLAFWSGVVLVATYFIQIASSTENFSKAFVHAAYVSIPIGFIIVLLRRSARFDIVTLANIILIALIPINIVGAIQQFVNPGFLVSYVYDIDAGGTIARNMSELDMVFTRLPSLFASADRYSGVAMMQFYLVVVITAMRRRDGWRATVWLWFNIVSAVGALLIAGARSRLFVICGLLLISGATLFFAGLTQSAKRQRAIVTKVIAIFVLGAVIVPGLRNRAADELGAAFPVIEFLRQSIHDGDVTARISETVSDSLPSDGTTLFGSGLGSVGEQGKPGETGIASMWVESGWLWGTILLVGYGGLLASLGLRAAGAAVRGEAITIIVYVTPLLLIVMALLTGLTASFELSSGMIMCLCIGYVMRDSLGKETIPMRYPLSSALFALRGSAKPHIFNSNAHRR